MTELKRIETSTTPPQQSLKAEGPSPQPARKRIKVQSDVRAGIVDCNGTLYP